MALRAEALESLLECERVALGLGQGCCCYWSGWGKGRPGESSCFDWPIESPVGVAVLDADDLDPRRDSGWMTELWRV